MGFARFKKKVKPIRLYLNCDELPIWNFSKLLSGASFEWLVYGYDGGVFDNELDEKVCYEIFEAIKEEYFETQGDSDALDIIILQAEIDHLVRRFNCVLHLLNVLETGMYTDKCEDEFIEELRQWKYFTSKRTLKNDIDKLKSQHNSSKTTIGRKKEELNTILKKNKGKKQSILQQKIKMQRVLSMQMSLKEVSVNEWLLMIKEVEQIIRSQNNGKRNKSS